MQQAARGASPYQRRLFDDVEPEWVEVDIKRVRVERCVDFGGPWLALELIQRLDLVPVLEELLPKGEEDIPWPLTALVLVISRFCDPSSELYIAERSYEHTALSDLLGIPAEKVNEDRLYRALDALIPHKEKLEMHLKNRLGTLFNLEYDLLLYDVTSTYFEGQAKANPLAKHGHSRDHRSDCKQVCIGLVVSKAGLPLGYEVFAGNRSDVTTLQGITTTMEARYGKADRIWVVDRGMVSEENIKFLKAEGRRYIAGTPKGMLKQYEQEILSEGWDIVHEGLEVKRCSSPDGEETFILCRSRDRREKEKAIHERFEQRIEEGLRAIEASCAERKYKLVTIAKRLGKLLGRNTRAAGLFETDVVEGASGRARLIWRKNEAWRDWAELSEGCYLLRTNINDWSGEELWKAYVQLTEAEAAFRIQKSDLRIRPIWHQKPERVAAHILVCFLAYVLWKTLGEMCRQAGLGTEPRRVLEEIARIKAVDVILPTKSGFEISRRCVSRPTDHQGILIQRLGLVLPTYLKMTYQN
jgi:transposase